MPTATNPPDLKDPAQAFEDLERQYGARRAEALLADASPAKADERQLLLTPSAIPVEYWRESDETWAAHTELLGVSAVADSEVQLFVEMARQVDEYWGILNERYSTLSDDLKEHLQLRYLGLRFEKTQS